MVGFASPQHIITTFSLALLLEIVGSSFMLSAGARSVDPVSLDPHFGLQSSDFLLATELVQADNPEAPENQFSQTEWNNFTPPSRGTPGRREGAGTRGGCPGGVTALIPASTLGRTALEKPTIYYYIPVPLEAASVSFELADEQNRTIYKKDLQIQGTEAGVVGLDLSEFEDGPSLEVGKNYRWFLILRCQPDDLDPSGDVIVDGWINRVALSETRLQELENLEPAKRLSLYLEDALWYETVKTLAELRMSNPQDASVEQLWAELLTSVGLGKIAPQPLISREWE